MKVQNVFFNFLILFVAFQTVLGQEKNKNNSCETFAKTVYSSINKTTGYIFLFIKLEYFTENDLKKIFICNSSKYPKLIYLRMTAFSEKKKLKKEIYFFKNPVDDTKIPAANLSELSDVQESVSADYFRADFTRQWISGDGREESFVFGPHKEGTRWRRVYIKQEEYKILIYPNWNN